MRLACAQDPEVVQKSPHVSSCPASVFLRFAQNCWSASSTCPKLPPLTQFLAALLRDVLVLIFGFSQYWAPNQIAPRTKSLVLTVLVIGTLPGLAAKKPTQYPARAAGLSGRLFEGLGGEEPPGQLFAAHTERILQILPRSRAEAVNRNEKGCDSHFVHDEIF